MIRSRLLVVLAVVALCVVGLSGRANVAAPAPGIKWEYKVTVFRGNPTEQSIKDDLNEASTDGWEMAGIFSDVHGGAAVATRGYLILKRQKQ